jgi:LPS-assembly protein
MVAGRAVDPCMSEDRIDRPAPRRDLWRSRLRAPRARRTAPWCRSQAKAALRVAMVLGSLCLWCGPRARAQQADIPAEFQNPFNTVTVFADSQHEAKNILTLTGHVEIHSREAVLFADEAVYDQSAGDVDATGHVSFGDPKAYLEAGHAIYNVKSEVGIFTTVHGYLHPAPRAHATIPMSGAFFIRAREVDRVGEDTYTVIDGRVSSCENERMGWWLAVQNARITVGDKAVSHGDVFHFLGVPMFYAPVLVHSTAQEPRQTGFLLPNIGNSSQKGRIIGDAFYWAINPSADLTLGVEDYSSRGLATIGRFRATPSATSEFAVNYLQVDDHGTGPLRAERAPGESIRAIGDDQDLGFGFRGVIDVDYINSLAFRLTWSNNFNEAVSSEARQTGFASRNFDGYSVNIYAHRYEDFLSSEEVPNNAVIIRETPSLDFAGVDHELGQSPFYLDFDASAVGIGREEPGFSTPTLTERLDFHPEITLRAPEFWGFHFTPTVGVEATRYGTSYFGPHDPLTRLLGEASFDLRPPSFERILDRRIRHYRLKNVIEPDIRYNLVRAADPEQITDIVRFDETDVLAETNEIEYSLKTTLYGRSDATYAPTEAATPAQTDGSQARELMSLSVTQKYYFDPSFGGVLQPGTNNVFAPTLDLTGFAFAQGRRLSPLVTILKVAPFSNFDTELRADISPSGGGVLNVGVTSSVHRGDFIFEATDFFVDREQGLSLLMPVVPILPTSTSSNLVNARLIYGHAESRGLSGAIGMNYNITAGLANALVGQLTYNFSCFGVDVGYNRFNLGPLRNENQFRIAISLSNVGSFGNLKERDRLFQTTGF